MQNTPYTMGRTARLAIILYAGLCSPGCSRAETRQPQTMLDKTLDAIHWVESRCGRDKRDGDQGKAIGPYQIHRAYWADAMRIMARKWPYSDARDPAKARAATRAYLTHYESRGTPETWARLHNSGPNWKHKKHLTNGYWAKVKKAIGQAVAKGK